MRLSKKQYEERKQDLLARARYLEWDESKWADTVLILEAENRRLQGVISKKSYDYGDMVDAWNRGQEEKIRRLAALHRERVSDARHV